MVAFIFIAQNNKSTLIKCRLHLEQEQQHYTANTTWSLYKYLHRQHANTELVKNREWCSSWRHADPSSAARAWSSTGSKGSDKQSGLHDCSIHLYLCVFKVESLWRLLLSLFGLDFSFAFCCWFCGHTTLKERLYVYIFRMVSFVSVCHCSLRFVKLTNDYMTVCFRSCYGVM